MLHVSIFLDFDSADMVSFNTKYLLKGLTYKLQAYQNQQVDISCKFGFSKLVIFAHMYKTF